MKTTTCGGEQSRKDSYNTKKMGLSHSTGALQALAIICLKLKGGHKELPPLNQEV